MSIEAINGVSNVSFKGNDKNTQEKTQQPTEIKEGKKKLALALGGLAALATAGIVIATRIQKGKGVDESAIEKGKEQAQQVVEDLSAKGQEVANNTQIRQKVINGVSSTDEFIKILPTAEEIEEVGGDLTKLKTNPLLPGFNKLDNGDYESYVDICGSQLGSEHKTMLTRYGWLTYHTSGENAGKFTFKKMSKVYDNNGVSAGRAHHANMVYDPKTGEKTMSLPRIIKSKTKLRTTQNGITIENGKKIATQTIEKLDDGTKKITVKYSDGDKIITISPDGKKNIADNRVFHL